ncbi:MAG: prepilin peptidase, partial [Phycisphaeraceae bacterium]|nr:prepilin peptidase [Phycisphaeraceae bacterium]
MHPHPRREVLKEELFLAPVVIGAFVAGYLAYRGIGPTDWLAAPPLAVKLLGGGLLGYFVGAGMIWGTRIAGTLAFGKEAMGLGDVHLLAAMGAVLGAVDAIGIFFLAPVVALALILLQMIWRRLRGKPPRMIPYGPFLSGAGLIWMLFEVPILQWLNL